MKYIIGVQLKYKDGTISNPIAFHIEAENPEHIQTQIQSELDKDDKYKDVGQFSITDVFSKSRKTITSLK